MRRIIRGLLSAMICLTLGITYLPILEPAEVEAVDASEDCAIDQFGITDMEDGTPKWDADSNAGNDNGPKNKIVRTFDTIAYTLEYSTKLKNKTKKIKETDATVELTLNADPSEAKFDTTSLGWMTNQKTKYYYSDNTSADTWDQKKTVTKQVLTGTRLLKNTNDNTAIPGVGKLTLRVAVQGAKNNQVLKPEFRMWIGGAQGEAKQAISEGVKVSARPMINTKVHANSATEHTRGYLHADGTFNHVKEDGTDKFGRLKGFSVLLEMFNPDAEKGRKGMEIPEGDITFDVQFNELHNGTDKTTQESYKPVIYEWDNNSINRDKGTNQRKTKIYGDWYNAGDPSIVDGSKGASRGWNRVYDGGDYTITDKGNGLFGVTLRNWSMDKEKYHSPNGHIHGRAWIDTYKKNEYVISALYMLALCQYPDTTSGSDTMKMDCTIQNLKVNTLTNKNVSTETKTDDNTATANVAINMGGYYTTRNIWTFSPDYGTGDASIALGKTTGEKGFYISMTNGLEVPLEGFDFLQKFDDKILQPTGKTEIGVDDLSGQNKVTKKVLFGAKPDKSGWKSDEEQQNASIENLIYFTDMKTLKDKGYTCVAVLGEVRNGWFWNGDGQNFMYIDYQVTSDASQAGKVAMTTYNSRGWNEANVKSQTDKTYSGVSGAYGLGSTETDWSATKFDAFQPKPAFWKKPTYTKTVYTNKEITEKHTGFNNGQSLLILSSKPSVALKSAKGAYDLDNGEREATLTITPNYVSETTRVEATLPKDLTYINDSANINPASIETKNGITTVIWNITDNKPITFKGLIGHAGTKEDIANGAKTGFEVRIKGQNDNRPYSTIDTNYRSTEFTVVNLATMSVSDSSDKLSHTVGDPLRFDMNIGNKSDKALKNLRLVNNLPANGDSAGSSFHGEYTSVITANFKDAPTTYNAVKGKTKLYVSMDKELTEANVKNKSTAGLREITGELDEATKTIKYIMPEGAVGIYYDLGGDLNGLEYIKLHLDITPTGGQEATDRYANEFKEYADNQLAVIDSNRTSIRIVGYKISGYVWNDANGDGLRGLGEGSTDEEQTKTNEAAKKDTKPEDSKTAKVKLETEEVTIYEGKFSKKDDKKWTVTYDLTAKKDVDKFTLYTDAITNKFEIDKYNIMNDVTKVEKKVVLTKGKDAVAYKDSFTEPFNFYTTFELKKDEKYTITYTITLKDTTASVMQVGVSANIKGYICDLVDLKTGEELHKLTKDKKVADTLAEMKGASAVVEDGEAEAGYMGRPVLLYNEAPTSKDQEPLQETVTDENGIYFFSSLTPGKYTVVVPNAHIYKHSPVDVNDNQNDDRDNDGVYNEELDMLIIDGIVIEDQENNYETDEFVYEAHDFGVRDILKDPVKILKTWKKDKEEYRPAEITVRVMDIETNEEVGTHSLTKDKSWVDVADYLRYYHNDGTEATYGYMEDLVEGYEGKINPTEDQVEIINTCTKPEELETGVKMKNFAIIAIGGLAILIVEETIRRIVKGKGAK